MKLYAVTVYPQPGIAECRVEKYDTPHGPLLDHYDLMKATENLLHRFSDYFFVGQTPAGMQLALAILVDLGRDESLLTETVLKDFIRQFLSAPMPAGVHRVDVWEKDIEAWSQGLAARSADDAAAADSAVADDRPGEQQNLEG